MQATFAVLWEDEDFEGWAKQCGLDGCTLEPRPDGSFDLTVYGSEECIDLFTCDLGVEPMKVFGLRGHEKSPAG